MEIWLRKKNSSIAALCNAHALVRAHTLTQTYTIILKAINSGSLNRVLCSFGSKRIFLSNIWDIPWYFLCTLWKSDSFSIDLEMDYKLNNEKGKKCAFVCVTAMERDNMYIHSLLFFFFKQIILEYIYVDSLKRLTWFQKFNYIYLVESMNERADENESECVRMIMSSSSSSSGKTNPKNMWNSWNIWINSKSAIIPNRSYSIIEKNYIICIFTILYALHINNFIRTKAMTMKRKHQ